MDKTAKQFIFIIVPILILQAIMLGYIFNAFYTNSATDIRAHGVSTTRSQASVVEEYLAQGTNILWFAAESVNFMLEQGENNEDITRYLIGATTQMQSRFDENFTGIYGYINGEYLDGAEWVPPEGYDPTTREWYLEAKEAENEMIISDPYVDAQTGEAVVSFSQLLLDNESVVALDVTLTEIQNITEQMTMDGAGYGFIVDRTGLVIAHRDMSEIGKNYLEDPDKALLLDAVMHSRNGKTELTVDGEKCTIFSEPIVKNWYVIIVAKNKLLFNNTRQQLYTSIILTVIIDIVIILFGVISARRILKAEQRDKESRERLEKMNINIIRSLASTIDAKDRYTSGHSRRVADYAVKIARKMGMSEEEQNIVFITGILHDVGKIRVPEEVINKPGKLTKEEFDQIKIHPVSGYHILHGIHEDPRIGYGSKYHHERYDGKGYPNGLAGENIPKIARIIAVADAYDAMASDRSYRKALPQDVVRKEIMEGKGSQFDPQIADIMLEIIDEDKDYELRQKDETLRHVLIVDDDLEFVNEIENILSEMSNIEIITARSEKEATQFIEEGDIDLVILDYAISETDGFELSRKIRNVHNIPVILMIEDKSREVISKIRELNIEDYLTKPLNPAITRETVYGVLRSDSTGNAV